MADKNRQKTTEKNNVNPQTGLTPLQEQVAMMLATGETISAVAVKLNVNRCTIYEWQRLVTFQCFLNKQAKDYRDNLRNGLFGLANDALQVVNDGLHSANETNRLKTAMWLIEKIKDLDTGQTDARSVLKEECTQEMFGWDGGMFDKKAYNDALQLYGLAE